jgi:hypothetical protein
VKKLEEDEYFNQKSGLIDDIGDEKQEIRVD